MFLGIEYVTWDELEAINRRTQLSKPTGILQLPVQLPTVTLQAAGSSLLPNNGITRFGPSQFEENYNSQATVGI